VNTWLRALVHELPALIVIVAVATLLKQFGLLYPIERFLIDLYAVSDSRAEAAYTALIDINEEDYNGPLFGGRSPIDVRILAGLIDGAAIAGSKAIVVDVDTDPAAVLSELKSRPGSSAALGVPIVWAIAGRQCPGTSCVLPSKPLMTAGSTLQSSGLAMLIHDGDGVLRRYVAEFETARALPENRCECTGSMAPTLPRAAAMAFDPSLAQRPAKPLTLNWRGDRRNSKRFGATQVLEGKDQAWWPTAASPMRDKVTVIGGTFSAARDTRPTPAGEMAGIEVVAHIIETELMGGGMAQYSLGVGILIEFVGGLALSVLNLRFPSITRRRLLANALMMFSVPLLASWLLYRFSLYWVSLAPVIAGVTLHQWHRRSHGLTPADTGHLRG
jgi:CHASE2 domain-containing sensor protein